jgi:glycosyltransferase involved in cell wall biosynthesis
MHLVIVHGYLLSGTGSNIYTANVAKTWKSLGHAVTVVCQDRKAGTLDFVEECFIGTDNIPTNAPRPGSIRAVIPDIDDLLLVYVYNPYDGFTVKAMGDASVCAIAEIDNHIEKTAAGLRKVLAQGVDRVLTNHTILSPVIAKRACEGTQVPYDVKIHGSSIYFSLKQRSELIKYAVEGLTRCEKIIAGTAYISRLLNETFAEYSDEIDLRRKCVIIPPGMDPDVFQLVDSVAKNQQRFLDKIKMFMARKPQGRQAAKVALPSNPTQVEDLHGSLGVLAGTYDQWAVDSDLLERWPSIVEGEPVIISFGTYLNTKGIGELVAAFPAILQQVPKARLLLIGYGPYREHMEGMLSSFESGNVESFIAFCQAGNFLDSSSDQLRTIFRKLSPEECQRITVTGITEHSQLSEILPVASVSIVATKCAEAFGMVMVESMSSGVLPLGNYHSGLADVLDVVKGADPSLEAMMHMDPKSGGKFEFADGSHIVEELPKRVIKALEYLYPNGYEDQSRRRQVSEKLRSIAVENFSWTKICKALLEPLPQ